MDQENAIIQKKQADNSTYDISDAIREMRMKINGISKIRKWLKQRGYNISYVTTDYYIYYDSFHEHQSYPVDVYQISAGRYILCKQSGRPRYYLCKTDNMLSSILLDFSQEHFLKRCEHEIPNIN